jgi:plastocyanin
MKNKSTFKLCAALAALMMFMLLTGCNKDNGYGSTGPSNTGSPGPDEVWMQNTAFNPSSLTISAGTTVTWINKDNMTHTATSGVPGNPNGMFNSGNMNQGATFSYTFNTAGTFDYYCIPHSATMKGKIIVQ